MAKIRVSQVSETEDGDILVAIPHSIAEKLNLKNGSYILYSSFLGMIVIKKISSVFLEDLQPEKVELAAI
ncbi:MAG: hypothetical protein AB1478_01760 [Nitrospirota bacterium]